MDDQINTSCKLQFSLQCIKRNRVDHVYLRILYLIEEHHRYPRELRGIAAGLEFPKNADGFHEILGGFN